ncbi:hypothetical protein FB639_001046 [Coemansia asiatica]|nr:hypothetical protein FB639_001046 [Coemansia asiatica]
MATFRSNSQKTRLRAEPVTGICGIVASGNAPVRLPAAPMTLKRQSSYASLKSNATLHASDENAKPTVITEKQHQRVLELLRIALASAANISLPGSELQSETNKTAAHTAASISLREERRARAVATLEKQRLALVGILRETQSPNAETIVSTHSLLCNRSRLRLLDMASARDYGRTMQGEADSQQVTEPIGIGNQEQAADATLASSLASDTSEETLIETGAEADVDLDAEYDGLMIRTSADGGSAPVSTASSTTSSTISSATSSATSSTTSSAGLKASLVEIWASNGFWRGASARSWSNTRTSRRESVCSINTLAIDQVAALPDVGGVCWALTEALHELSTQSWSRFYASLGGVRVPTRYRTPRHSLNMLATEQLMMCNDKLVCPLKNRVQEPNPRRQVFEEYIRTTGTLPPPDSVADRKIRSPLCNEL